MAYKVKSSDINQLRQNTLMGGFDIGGYGGAEPYQQSFEPTPTYQSPVRDPYLGMPPDAPDTFEPPVSGPPPTYDKGNQGSDILALINQMYSPETRATNRFNDLLDNPPERQAPSFMRSLIAGGLSLKAEDPVAMADKVQYAPYYRDAADWKLKAEPFQQAASQENTANVNERNLVTQTALARNTEMKNAEIARNNDLKNQVAIEKNQITLEKQRGTTFEARGEFLIAHRADGTAYNTGIRTSNFSPFELENMKHEHAMAQQGLRNTGNANVAGIMAGRVTPPSAAQQEAQRQQKMLELVSSGNPEIRDMARRYITQASDGTLALRKSPNDEGGIMEYNFILGELYPKPPQGDINLPIQPGDPTPRLPIPGGGRVPPSAPPPVPQQSTPTYGPQMSQDPSMGITTGGGESEGLGFLRNIPNPETMKTNIPVPSMTPAPIGGSNVVPVPPGQTGPPQLTKPQQVEAVASGRMVYMVDAQGTKYTVPNSPEAIDWAMKNPPYLKPIQIAQPKPIFWK